MTKRVHRFCIVAILLAGLCLPLKAQSLVLKEQGRWRLELQGAGGIFSGKDDRDGDFYFTGNFEYEFLVSTNWTLGLRCNPLLVYAEQNGNDNANHTLYGSALGFSTRYYFEWESYEKWYLEGAFSLLWQSREFGGNSARVNTFTEAGIGYAFPDSPFSVAFKYSHISNADTSHDNSAVNGFLLALGYRF